MVITLRTDGAARGNPGPAGAGIIIEDEAGRVLERASKFLGKLTNNQAEYKALIYGLTKAVRYAFGQPLHVLLDSDLLVGQLTGRYKVRNRELKQLFGYVRELERGFAAVRYEHIPRRQNRQADLLANEAIEKG